MVCPLETHSCLSERHAHYVIKRLEADNFPEIGLRPLSEIPTSAFRGAVRKIELRGALDIAKRVLQNCGQIMRYAVANDLAKHNPVADVKPADVLKPHKRRNYPRVGAKELPDLLHAIDGYVGSEHTRLALQLMALTFVRTSELIGARWSEFDVKAARWDIPAERMKMKTPHIVALSTQALAALGRRRESAQAHEQQHTPVRAVSNGLSRTNDRARLPRRRIDHLARAKLAARAHRTAARPPGA